MWAETDDIDRSYLELESGEGDLPYLLDSVPSNSFL